MNWFHDPLIETFGRTLLYSLWQLSTIAAATSILLLLLRRRSANTRYTLCLTALLLMTATPPATFLYLKPVSVPVPFTQGVTTGSPEHVASVTIASAPLSITKGSPTWSREMLESMHPLLPFAVAAYFLGTLFFSLRLAVGYLRVRRLPQKSMPVTREIHDLFISLCRRLAISRPVQLLESALVEVPTILGELRPIILVPATAITGMPIQHLQDLLAHELAHVRRHDYLVNIFQCIIETLLFYHPAIWWLSTRIRQERENCCDDIAVALSGNRLNYAQALAAMESLRANPASIPASLILGARSGALLPRIRRVLSLPRQENTHQLSFSSALLTLLTVVSLIYILGCERPNPAPLASPAESSEHGTRDDGNGPVISFETHFFLLDEATMKRLGTIWPQSPNWPLSPKASDVASDANPTAPSNTEGMSVLSPTDLDAFLKLVESSKGSASVASPRLTLFNRERGLVKIEQEMSYISGYKQTPGSPPVPVVSVLETGISVPIHAEIFYDQKSVVTDFHFKATSLISFDHFSDPQKNFGLQIPRIDQSERAAVVVIPENLTLIVFGLPISGSLGLSEDVEHSKDPQNDANSTNKAGEAHYPVLCLRPKILRGENAPFTPTVSSTKPAK